MIRHVMVVGYGVMGRGISLSFARGGHQVRVVSRNPERITSAPRGISIINEFPDHPPDLIIEAVPEEIELKRSLFSRIEQKYSGLPIIATNTSGLSLEEMAGSLRYPTRFIGIHYFHPAELFPTVEVICAKQTDPSLVDEVKNALKRNNQRPVVIKQPIAGFLVNRLQHAMLHEAFSLVEQGIVTAEDVDIVCKTMFGPRMCVTGLIEQKDISGLQTTAATQRNLVPQLNHSGIPTQEIQKMVARGDIGVKSGRGFYDWTDRDIENHQARAREKIERILEIITDSSSQSG